MNERNKIDDVIRKLARASALDKSTAEELINAPDLLRRITANIEREKEARAVESVSAPVFIKQKHAAANSWFGWRTASVYAGFLLIFTVTAAVVVRFGQRENALQPKTQVLETVSEVEPQLLDKIQNPSFAANPSGDTKPNQTDDKPQSRKAVLTFAPKAKKTQIIKTASRTSAARTTSAETNRARTAATIADGKASKAFYPLGYAVNFDEPENRQLVRVELSRAALVKLGLLERIVPDREQVTADLLVGENGLPQAIRFVE